mgnify:CR=1 FL=1
MPSSLKLIPCERFPFCFAVSLAPNLSPAKLPSCKSAESKSVVVFANVHVEISKAEVKSNLYIPSLSAPPTLLPLPYTVKSFSPSLLNSKSKTLFVPLPVASP